ncbi:hypothetical protein [Hymenobacter sp. GOD-10R]|uniref:hypothetical protein n=1 Tax=Hymenobacter sp. GOD-10R TaxID=3093922 RepID=UPI002D78E095|nr:hypothetical protein [Hymenobacter sp. GOD-10R]WRQ31850.1 hypothetical protein SD425_29340 [Hymenobacter sp. GOD-10R]
MVKPSRLRTKARGPFLLALVTLRPYLVLGTAVDKATVTHRHHEAHKQCDLVNPVKATRDVQGFWECAS